MSFLPSMPDATLLDVFKAYPEVARPLHELAQQVMRGPSPLSEGERELIAAYVSALNGCAFCQRAHAAVAERFGVAPGAVDQLARDLDGADVPDRLKAILRYVRKLNDTPGEVARADVDAVLEAGWDEQALNHAALVCAHFNFMNRWVDGLGIEVDPNMVEIASRQLHERGYRGILDLLDGRHSARRAG